MTRTRAAMVLLVALALATPALAELRSLPVAEGIWAIVGEKGQRSAENLGNNATFGLIAIGDHHRMHHIAMARGDGPH